ncbi:MAG: hypothetical protein OEX19_09880, partial [Gammaproteobacteria bacterium]|nr:hypothetical protein [Gammaproteobacteria bacterium]
MVNKKGSAPFIPCSVLAGLIAPPHVIPDPEPESNNSVIAKSRSGCGNLSLSHRSLQSVGHWQTI